MFLIASIVAKNGGGLEQSGTGPLFHFKNNFMSDHIPPTICGRRLKPLSEDRYRLLRRFDVSFVADTDTDATARDLMYGVLICSMSPDEFYQFVSSTKLETKLKKWARANCFLAPKCFSWPCIGRLLCWIGGLRVDMFDAAFLNQEIRRFQSYINESKAFCSFYWRNV